MIGRAMSFAVLAAFILSFASLANAATDPGVACAVSKQKAAAKKLSAKVKCHGTAMKKGVAVDAACLTNAEAKFDESFAKAEAKGGCITTADAATIEALIDDTLDELRQALPPAQPCPGAGSSTACQAYVDVVACTTCCDANFECLMECGTAEAFTCAGTPYNDFCSAAANAAGCAAVCCP